MPPRWRNLQSCNRLSRLEATLESAQAKFEAKLETRLANLEARLETSQAKLDDSQAKLAAALETAQAQSATMLERSQDKLQSRFTFIAVVFAALFLMAAPQSSLVGILLSRLLPL